MLNPALAYRQTQVGTTGQGELVVMLFAGALRYLEQARAKMLAKDYAAKGILISKAMDVINELDTSLNMEAGGDLAQNLHNLYFLCNTKLLQANLKLDVQILDNVREILSGIHSAFAQILNNPDAQAACASIGAKQAHRTQTANQAKTMVDAQNTVKTGNPTAFQQALQARSVPGLTAPLPKPALANPAPQAAHNANTLRKLAAYSNAPK